MCERVRLIILFYFSVYSAKQVESAVHWFVRRKARGDGSATADKRPAGGRRQRDSHGIYHTCITTAFTRSLCSCDQLCAHILFIPPVKLYLWTARMLFYPMENATVSKFVFCRLFTHHLKFCVNCVLNQ